VTSGTFAAVVAEATRSAPATVAHRLSLPVDLVVSILEEAEALGLVTRYPQRQACPSSGSGCDGCPLTRVCHPA
jgi:hypothetical protein